MNAKRKQKKNTPTLAIDFFCGAGGMTCGLIKAGFHVLAGIDNEPLCEKTYRQNRNKDRSRPAYLCENIFRKNKKHPDGEQQIIQRNLRKLIAEYKRDKAVKKIKLIFAICAPCQPFTKITKIELSSDRKFKRENDADLLLTTLGLIRHFKPEAIICENVEGIVSTEPNSVIKRFKQCLTYAGYKFDAKIINASQFGVPQNRRRTIGFAFKKEQLKDKISIPEKAPKHTKTKTVKQTIGYLPALAAGEIDPKVRNHRARSLSNLNLKRIASVRPGQTNIALRDTPYGDLSLDCHRRLQNNTGQQSFSDTYTRMRGDDLAPTITTKCISITNGRFGHYDMTQNRAITPREAALLQTFPKSYVFYPEDSIEFTATMIGNAVPPKLAKFMGRFVAGVLS